MDWLRSCLPACLQWRRRQADSEGRIGAAQTEAENDAASRLLDALNGGQSTKSKPVIPAVDTDTFVNICVEAVQHEVKRNFLDQELQNRKCQPSPTQHCN